MKADSNVRLIWDIDGTLLDTKGVAAAALSTSISVYAEKHIAIVKKNTSGFTDYEIVINLLQENKISFCIADVTKILENYIQRLSSTLTETNLHILNKVDLVLEKIMDIESMELSIGTGNCLSGAMLKLECANLLKFFPKANMFCATEVYWSRDLVIKNAKNSLSKYCLGVVIGDSPMDIISARKNKLRVIATASGAHSYDQLLAFKPDEILNRSWNYYELMQAVDKIKSIESIY